MKLRSQLAVWGFFFCVFMLTTSREPPWNDASLIYHTAGSIVLRGGVGMPVPGVANAFSYSPHPLLPSLTQVPGFMLYQWLIARQMEAWSLWKVLTTHLAPAFFGALTCSLFLNACLRLGMRLRTASFATLAVGLCTSVWVYARSPYSEIVQAAAFMGLVGALLGFWRTPRKGTAFQVGLWAALVVNAKVVFVLCLPGALALCVYRMRKQLSEFARLLPWAFLPMIGGALIISAHNQARTGAATNSGYAVAPEIFAQPFWEGAFGLLASPGRSVFLFSPPLVLSLLGLGWAYKNKSHLLWMLSLCSIPVFCVYAKYEAWSGDWGWGPRYLVPFLAPMMLPGALWLQHCWPRTPQLTARLRHVLVATVLIGGLTTQLLGNLFYWDHFIRISQEARNGWLGNPNRLGSKGVARATSCDPCFEDFYPFQWLPPFQQIAGHWWLLKTVPRRTSWIEATKTAPWSRYTGMHVPIARSYPQARIDWWPLEFGKKFTPHTAWILILLGLGTGICGATWLTSLPAKEPSDTRPTGRQKPAPEPV